MLGLIYFNLRYKNTNITDKHFARIMAKINKSTVLYKLLAMLAVITVVAIAFAEVFGVKDQIDAIINPDMVKPIIAGAGAIFVISGYIVFTSRKVKISATNILIKRSSQLIKKTLEANNLDSKTVIITNVSNGRELGFTSDSAIVAVVPKRNTLSMFEVFIDFVNINNRLYPIFKNDKAHVLNIDFKDLLSIEEYFERGNYVPQPVKKAIDVLIDNKKVLNDYGMDLEEIIAPQENTVIELKTTMNKIGFRNYKFKEILSGVYTELSKKENSASLKEENIELRKQVARYKAKLMEVNE